MACLHTIHTQLALCKRGVFFNSSVQLQGGSMIRISHVRGLEGKDKAMALGTRLPEGASCVGGTN